MAKFRVLKYNEWTMSKLGIYSHPTDDPTKNCFKLIIRYYILLSIVCFNVISSAVYVYLHWPNFELIFEPLFLVFGNIQIFGMFFNITLQMEEIKNLHIQLQEIVDNEDNEDEIYENYWKSEQKCRKYTKIIWSYFFLNQSLLIFPLFCSFYYICVGQFDTTKMTLPFAIFVPFDSTTFFGWYLLWFIQFNMATVYALAILSITSYFVACSVYICAICDHVNLLLKPIKQDVLDDRRQERKKTEAKNKSLAYRSKIKRVVDIHSKLYDAFVIVANMNSGTIFSMLPCNVIFMALTMYNAENSPFVAGLLIWRVASIVSSLLWPYLFCHYANVVTDRIHDVGEHAYASDWYEYPVELQKSMILIIARSQKPIKFTGLNLFDCNMEVFGKIFKSSCSYYLIFRRLTEL